MVASGTNPKKPQEPAALPILVGAGAVVLLIAFIGWLATRGGDDAGPSNDALDEQRSFSSPVTSPDRAPSSMPSRV